MTSGRILRWTYAPANYFEVAVRLITAAGQLTFDAGDATLVAPGSHGSASRADLEEATALVVASLNARRVRAGRPYTLTAPAVVVSQPDGTQVYRVYSEARFVEGESVTLGCVLRDSSGGVVHDSRAEDAARESHEFETIACSAVTSPVLRHMLRSYCNALDDSQNALVHLYEIQDAAKKHYGQDARSHLRIDKDSWKLLGRLANDEPLHEGRHRGRMGDSLRHATPDEMSSARNAAFLIMKAFADLHSTHRG